MAIRLSFTIAGLALGGLAACGALVSLDQVDPSTSTSIQGNDGGVVTGTGSTTAGGVTISPTTIDISDVRCGSQKPVVITLTNPSDTDAQYQMALSGTSSFQLGDPDAGSVTGTVAAKSQATVTLLGLGNAPGNDSATILVNIGDDTKEINATIERTGGSLTISPGALNFGQVRKENGSDPTNVVFQNNGNAPITLVSFHGSGSDNADQFTTPTNVSVLPGQSVPAPFKLNSSAGPDAAQVTATLVPVINDAYCGTIPTLSVSGQRITTDVTVTPATLDFGNAGCGETANTQPTLTITNYYPGAVPYTLSLPNPTKYAFVGQAGSSITGTAAAGDGTNPTQTTIKLQIALPMDDNPTDYTEQLTVQTGASVGNPPLQNSTVGLTTHVLGAVFAVTEDVTVGGFFHPFPALNGMKSGDTGVGTIQNIGNATACVTYSVDDQGFQAHSGGAIQTGDPYYLEVDDKSCSSISGTLTINHANCNGQTSWPFCKPPPTLALKGSADCNSSSGGGGGGRFP